MATPKDKTAKSKLDQLHDFLLNLPDEHDGAMLIEELDGFLAGVIVCPEMILPSRWMPHIWSETGSKDHAPVFENMTQVQHITGLIMDHYNSIAKSLLPGPAAYEPVFAVDTRNDDVLWEMWAEGFSRAVALTPASWLTIIESGDTDAVAAFSGLRSLIAIASGESTLSKPEQDRLTAEAPDLIPEWVEILSYWRLAHNPIAASSATATFKNTGRNDPCPCGSGKKYKKCHGAN
jgi:uncharacterized protein